MFSKKCPKCERKIKKEFDFCPYCGSDFRIEKRMKKERDFGLLGKDDLIENRIPALPMGLGGIDKMFSSLLNEMTRQIDSQFKEIDKPAKQEKKNVNSISISISTGTGKKPEIKIQTSGPEFKNMQKQQEVQLQKPRMTDEEARVLSKLPKKEAETNVRRLSNKIIYEIDIPGTKNLNDIIINKLENSIEIKAFTKNTAYFKLIPIKAPLLSYKLKDEKLILEFSPSQ